MTSRRDIGLASSLRLLAVAFALGLCLSTGALAQTLLPAGFFDNLNVSPNGQAAIEADLLSYDADADVITASGNVQMVYEGYTIKADRLVYRQGEGAVTAEGNVEVTDVSGTHFVADHVDITGNFQKAFIRSLTLTTADGSTITAEDADFSSELEIILNEASYSPCGLCIDAKGRRIGWRVRGSRMIYVRDKGTIEVYNPSLELLGIPMAWLPWISIPDPSQPRLSGFRLPKTDYSEQMGFTVELPYFWAPHEDTDVLISPRLMSRQGALFAVEVTHRFKRGVADVKASGVYQLDPNAFVGTVGDTTWRGAIQTTGRFTPVPTWTTGWSYTRFTDAAYLVDYRLVSGKNVVNEVYLTHLSRDSFIDLRVQDFNLLGNKSVEQQQQNAKSIPAFRGEHVVDLRNGWGQVRLRGDVLGVYRGADQTATYNGVPYVYAYRETKFHGMVEGTWEKQFVVPGGFLATPFAGLRLDAASYDGGSVLLPGEQVLLSATPLAALDIRWPLMATNANGNSHLFEPVAQLVYRGGSNTLPGITNDNAQSFVLDDSNIFSYNRFSGTDRQETGLRANVGGRYQAYLQNGSWVELLAGESFYLAGANSLSISDPTQTGLHTGLGTEASYIVLAARSGFRQVETGTELIIDPNDAKVRRVEAGGRWWNNQGVSANVQYIYLAADPIVGVIADQHEIAVGVGFPLADYWSLSLAASWDLATNSFLDAGSAVMYNDGYVGFGLYTSMTGPTHNKPNDFQIGTSIKLRGPGGEFGF